MEFASRLQRVIVAPRNGYANRLQAWASSSIMAERLGAPLQVAWEPESVAPAEAADLFADSLRDESFISPSQTAELLGRAHQEMPRYLTVDPDQGVVFLAGHDRGEQQFMPELQEILATTAGVSTVVIVAGGKFHLADESDFSSKRRDFYFGIDWHPAVQERVHMHLANSHPYLGLHIRQTDRSRNAPTPRAIQEALVRLTKLTGVMDLFIAADTPSARAEWTKRASDLGLRSWTSDATSFDRTDKQSGQDAIVDWLLLGKAEAIVYSAASSFGQEAAVSNAHPGLAQALTAPSVLRVLRDTKRLATSALGRVNPRQP